MNLLAVFILMKIFTKNNFIPDCKKCIYYKEYFSSPRDITKQQLCTKYGEKEDLTGRILFYEAKKCRDDVFRCGENGKYFTSHNETAK